MERQDINKQIEQIVSMSEKGIIEFHLMKKMKIIS